MTSDEMKAYERRLAEFRAIKERTGIPMGSLQTAERLLVQGMGLCRNAQLELIAAAIHSAWKDGHQAGRALQRAWARKEQGGR
jgi:hypothetical protein